jgi:5-methylcytosine-specific restriction endonuclease McrA
MLLPRDREHYPKETSRVVEWIKKRGAGSFSRADAAAAALKCGLVDRQHKGFERHHQTGQGTMYEALEILEVYDYIRSFFTRRKATHHFIVNPAVLLRPDPEPVTSTVQPMKRAFSHEQKREIWFAAGGRCSICRIELSPDWHADHRYPWSRGGSTSLRNAMALCGPCNLRKSAKGLTGEEGQMR